MGHPIDRYHVVIESGGIPHGVREKSLTRQREGFAVRIPPANELSWDPLRQPPGSACTGNDFATAIPTLSSCSCMVGSGPNSDAVEIGSETKHFVHFNFHLLFICLA